MLIGYARTSTVDQVAGLEAQETALAATGCSKIIKEQASSVGQRDGLAAVLDFVREGDTLVISRLADDGIVSIGHPGIARVGFREPFLPKCLKKGAVQTAPSARVGLAWVKPKSPSALAPNAAENLAFRGGLPSPS